MKQQMCQSSFFEFIQAIWPKIKFLTTNGVFPVASRTRRLESRPDHYLDLFLASPVLKSRPRL